MVSLEIICCLFTVALTIGALLKRSRPCIMLEKARKGGESFKYPLLKITRNVICEDLHAREKALVVTDFWASLPT